MREVRQARTPTRRASPHLQARVSGTPERSARGLPTVPRGNPLASAGERQSGTVHLRLPDRGGGAAMTTFTMRRVGGDFVVTGPDIEPRNSRRAGRRRIGA